jgi:tetratricopeptide (TPR) repeat protein
MVKFLIGREYLFLVDRESVLQFARDAFEKEAEQAFHQAIRLRQDYARAYVGLGGVYFKRAQRLINPPEEGTSAGSQENTDLAAAKSITEDAIAAYNTVVDLNPDPAEYGIPLDSVARLGLGNSYRLQGQISWLQGNDQQAFGYFDQAIHALESTIVPFADAGQERYLTQAYEYLGATHQWRGYLYEVSQDFASSLESYRLSAEYFEKCIAQGDHSGDRIITEEIIAKICSPNHTSIREIIESLEGGEG